MHTIHSICQTINHGAKGYLLKPLKDAELEIIFKILLMNSIAIWDDEQQANSILNENDTISEMQFLLRRQCCM